MRVLQPTIADTIEFQTGGIDPLTSSPAFHYQIFPVEVQATGEETFYGPQTDDFRLRNSTNGYTPVGVNASRTLELSACGGSVYDHDSIAEENTDSGYLVFETPSSVSVSDVKLSTTFDPELNGSVGATWDEGPDSG